MGTIISVGGHEVVSSGSLLIRSLENILKFEHDGQITELLVNLDPGPSGGKWQYGGDVVSDFIRPNSFIQMQLGSDGRYSLRAIMTPLHDISDGFFRVEYTISKNIGLDVA